MKNPTSSASPILKWLPLLGGFIAISLILNAVYQNAMSKTNNTLVYALDDPYIHMAIAKNLAHHGVWGISSDAPGSASSSPLWTLILAICSFLPIDGSLLPLILNFVFIICFLVVFYRLTSAVLPNPWIRAAVATLVVFAMPAAALVLIGMEHSLHCLLTIVFIAILIRHDRTDKSPKFLAAVVALGFAMTMTRYESVFLFLIPGAWGLYRRQPLLVAPMVGAIMGVIFFGLLSVRVGMPFVPSTLLLKSDLSSSTGFFGAMWQRIKFNAFPFIEFPTVAEVGYAGVVALLFTLWASPRIRLAAVSVLLAAALQVAFVSTQQLYRYESYLVAAMSLVLVFGLREARGPQRRLSIAAGGVFAVTLVMRGVAGYERTPMAVQNIYDQQYQMSEFLNLYYSDKTVALNDIGVCSYYTNCRVVDLYGLANDEVRKEKESGTFNTDSIYKILETNKVDVAILYPIWFHDYGGLPLNYLHPITEWRILEENVVCKWPIVCIMARLDNGFAVRRDAREFESKLPPTVQARYFEINGH